MERSSETSPRNRGPRDPVTRAFAVLLWMADAPGASWGLREIAKNVDMPPSTLHRVLAPPLRLARVAASEHAEHGRRTPWPTSP